MRRRRPDEDRRLLGLRVSRMRDRPREQAAVEPDAERSEGAAPPSPIPVWDSHDGIAIEVGQPLHQHIRIEPASTKKCALQPPRRSTLDEPATSERSSNPLPWSSHRPGLGSTSAGTRGLQQRTPCVPTGPPLSAKHFGQRKKTPSASAIESTGTWYSCSVCGETVRQSGAPTWHGRISRRTSVGSRSRNLTRSPRRPRPSGPRASPSAPRGRARSRRSTRAARPSKTGDTAAASGPGAGRTC